MKGELIGREGEGEEREKKEKRKERKRKKERERKRKIVRVCRVFKTRVFETRFRFYAI